MSARANCIILIRGAKGKVGSEGIAASEEEASCYLAMNRFANERG